MSWNWEGVPALTIDEGGEPLYAAYRSWTFAPKVKRAFTKSQWDFLSVNVGLYEDEQITLPQACMNELTFVWYGVTWIDKPERNGKSISKQVIEALANGDMLRS